MCSFNKNSDEKMEQKMDNHSSKIFIIRWLILIPLIIPSWAQAVEKVGCFSVDGRTNHPCGQSWSDTYNGVVYDCTCNCSSRGSDCNPRSKSNTTGGYSGGSAQQQIQMMIFQSLFDSLFASPPDTSAQDEIARQNTLKRQQENEQKKQAAIQRYYDLQSEDAMKKQMEQNAKIKQGAQVLSKTKIGGSVGELKPFSFGNPKLDLKPIGQTYPAPSTAWEQALCATYFSNLAKQSSKDVDVRFYADQAQRVMSGETTYLECRIPQVSNEKLAKRMKEAKKVYDQMNIKIKDLQDIEYKLSESKEKIDKAELKKEKTTAQINELQTRIATAKPEEKAELEDLAAMAQELMRDAEEELKQAKQSEKDVLLQKDQLENELRNMNAQMQDKIQVGVD